MPQWLKIEDWQQDEIPWPGDKIDAEYALGIPSTTAIAVWLKNMEAQFDASLLFQYDGYTWDPDSDRIIFHFTVRDWVQDIESGNLKVRKDGKYQEQQIDPIEASPMGLAGIIVGGVVAVAGFKWLREREMRIKFGYIHDIMMNPDLTPEQKDKSWTAYMKDGYSGTWREDVKQTMSSAAMLVVAVIVLLLVWPVLGRGGSK